MPNGAQALIRTLVDAGVTTCFTNPGTSELQFVAELDSVPEMRAILTLFEGVATGAADGYARMAGAPAATLLHLGPGLGNGLANLHNARRARVPVINIVGDHATYHTQYDTPLQSDIETVARNVSTWVRTSRKTEELARDAVEAIAAAIGPPGQVATLIVPADVSWQDGAEPAAPPKPAASPPVSGETIEAAARAIRGSPRTGILLGGQALRERGLLAAARIASVTEAKLFAERNVARLERGAGLPAVERLAYWPELVSKQLDGLEHLILAGTTAPHSLFAYQGKQSSLVPAGCEVHELSPPASDVIRALEELVEALDAADAKPALQTGFVPPRPEGPLTAEKVCQAIGATLPEGAILSDEAITSALALAGQYRGGSPARLAHPDRRRDRPGAAGRGWGSDRVSGSPGHRTRGRRLGSLHHPVALDDGARTARRHRRDLQQPWLRDPQDGVGTHRRPSGRSQSQGSARFGESGRRFRRARHWARHLVAPGRHGGTAHRCP